MFLFRFRLSVGICLALALSVSAPNPVSAGDAKLPEVLRAIPKEADLVVVVEHPRKFAEAARDLPIYQSASKAIPAVREFFDGTSFRRFHQFLAYAEKELGADWPVLLDKLAGNGLAIATRTGTEPAPALLIARGTDEKLSEKAFQLLVRVAEEETARLSDAPKIRKAEHAGVETIHLGTDLSAARVGVTIFLSNQELALHKALDLAVAGKPGASLADRETVPAARKLVGGEPLAWLWFDLARAKESKQAKDFFETSRKDVLQTLVIGGTVDAIRRSDYLAVGVHQTPAGYRVALRLPAKSSELGNDAGTAGRTPFAKLHTPDTGKPGSLPLLQPQGTIYSQSFYLDLATFWNDRKTLLNPQVLKDIEQAEKDGSKILPGTTIGKLLTQTGPYHRVVVANRSEKLYDTEPTFPIPSIAVVSAFRDPEFAKSIDGVLRGAGLFASFQLKLKMSETTQDGVKIVTYRFPENGDYPGGDPANYRFNFAPSYAIVDDFLVASTTPDLVRSLIPELRKPAVSEKSPSVWRGRAFADGAATFLRANPDPTVTDTILNDGVGLDTAKKQVADFANWLATLGSLGIEVDHDTEAFELRVEWKLKN